jgi:hypothetical protein
MLNDINLDVNSFIREIYRRFYMRYVHVTAKSVNPLLQNRGILPSNNRTPPRTQSVVEICTRAESSSVKLMTRGGEVWIMNGVLGNCVQVGPKSLCSRHPLKS